MAKTGRPTKYNQERAETILDALRRGATLAMAAAQAGVCDDTLRGWRKTRTAFALQVDQALAEGALRALDVIWAAAKAGDWRAAAWLLERRYPEDFGRQAADVRAQGEITIRVIDESRDADVDPFAP